MSDGADTSNQVRGTVHGAVVQAGSIQQVVLHLTPEHVGATAMFSQRADIATFTGRDEELHTLLDTVLAALPDPHPDAPQSTNASTDGDGSENGGGVRAIAIHTVEGMPGVGKTAFTVHAAHRLAARFPDGNLFLDLQGHAPGRHPLSPGAALESLLRAQGVDPKMIPAGLEDRARLWRDRMAGKKVLLVLDDAADHDQVRALLPGTAGNLVLITSRHRLATLEGVTPLTLDVLPVDQAIALLTRLAGRHSAPGTDEQDEQAGMRRIVGCCGYLPLAISLAGALLRNHPRWSSPHLADLLAVEQERLEHLDVGDRSVRAAFAMSFRHLPAEHQRLFRLLGVHPGPDIDLFATAALTGDTLRETRRGLAGLHADHLIEETTPGRYRLHDLLRVYARTLATDLATDDHQDALDRVVSYYLHTMRVANRYLPVFRTSPLSPVTIIPMQAPDLDDAPAAQSWLATELPTLIACVRSTITPSSSPHLALHLAAALYPFLRLSGRTDQAVDIHQAGLTTAVQLNDRIARASILHDLGRVQHVRGEYAAASDNHARALDLFTAAGDLDGQAETLNNLGDLALYDSAAGDPTLTSTAR